MSTLIYALCSRLFQILAGIGVGTNLGLYQVFFALLSGRCLQSRGALFPALTDSGLPPEAVRRSVAAVAYGKWKITDLIAAWQKCVRKECRFRAHCYEGYSPVACDLVGFFRPRLQGQVGKHYTSKSDKAQPAIIFGMVATVGSVGSKRLPLLRALTRQKPQETEVQLQARLLKETASTLTPKELFVADAGFALTDCLLCEGAGFVIPLGDVKTVETQEEFKATPIVLGLFDDVTFTLAPDIAPLGGTGFGKIEMATLTTTPPPPPVMFMSTLIFNSPKWTFTTKLSKGYRYKVTGNIVAPPGDQSLSQPAEFALPGSNAVSLPLTLTLLLQLNVHTFSAGSPNNIPKALNVQVKGPTGQPFAAGGSTEGTPGSFVFGVLYLPPGVYTVVIDQSDSGGKWSGSTMVTVQRGLAQPVDVVGTYTPNPPPKHP